MGYLTKGSFEQNRATKIKLLFSLVVGATCLVATILTMVLDPVHIIARFCSRVDYGTLVYKAVTEEYDSIHLSVYLFNITNAEQFVSGEDTKLKVEEVGPFTYQENRTNEDLEIDKNAGVMRYTPRHRVTFLPEESIGRPEDIILTLPNIAMLSLASAVSSYGFIAKMGFNLLVSRLDSNVTVQMSAHDYLWGYNEPLISLGNTVLPGWINFDTMGLLDRLYDKKASFRIEVSANNEDKFMIKTINGVGGLPSWGYPEKSSSCNSFNNSFEGLLYPPEMSPRRPLKIYRNVLCRFMEMDYVGEKMMDFGVEGMAYKFSNKSFSMIPENECMCTKGVCHEGVSDLSTCFYGLPVVLSNAHFLDTNESVYERVEGMTPNEEQHGSDIIIEPVIGMVMKTKFSVQLNVLVEDANFNSKTSSFSNMVVPVGYFKVLQPKMPDAHVANLKMIHIYGPYILLGVQILLVFTGLLLLANSARLLYYNWICAERKGTDFDSEKMNAKETLSAQPLIIERQK